MKVDNVQETRSYDKKDKHESSNSVQTHVAKVGLPNKLQLQLLHLLSFNLLLTLKMPEDPDKNNTNNDNPTNRSNMPQNNEWDNESNPFVAFRRFADEQVSSVLQSITGLPSSINPPQPDNWTIFTDDKGYKSMAYRHRGGGSGSSANNAPDRDSTQNPGANSPPDDGEDNSSSNNSNNNDQNPPSRSQQPPHSENTQQPPQPPSLNRQRHEHRPSDFLGLDTFFDRFEDTFFPFRSPFFHPHRDLFPAAMFNDESSNWPFTYVMLSPYSPLHLERQAHYRMHRDQGVFSSIMSSLRFDSDSELTRDPSEPQWREAFEDLLRLENGKPMLERDSLATTKTRPENGMEWMYGLVKRGSLGDQWKYVSGTDRHPWTGITFSGYNENEESHDRDQPELNTKALENQAAHDEAEAETELELYERFLRDIEAREHEFTQEIASSPLLRALLGDQQRRRNVFEKYERGWPSDEDQGNDDTESWLDLISGGNRKSVPETTDPVPVPTPAGEQAAVASENHTARVVSTMINTERTCLPDGSVQTKKVTTKRYEDGREETESLTETTHPRNEDGSNDQSSGTKNGWFWRD